jgi:transposase InsO family protein
MGIEEMREKTGMSYRDLCGALRVPWSSFNRWRQRIQKAAVLIKPPGPKKVEPFDPAALAADVLSLGHRCKRSQGADSLYGRYRQMVSRRELSRMVWQVRHDLWASQRKNLRRIEWLVPGVVWSMDATEYDRQEGSAGKIHLHSMQDLGSRYKFPPMAGGYPVGEEIAGYLADKMYRYRPPLFLKRDNGGNMNHRAVNEVLSELFILPLNSPAYYAPYNGAIEESQGELKRCLRDRLGSVLSCSREQIEPYAEAAVHDLNHRLRDCLGGKTSCQVFFHFQDQPIFTKRERRDIYECLMERAERILLKMGQFGSAVKESAWRIAVESWLRSKGYIKVKTDRKVSPNLNPILVP